MSFSLRSLKRWISNSGLVNNKRSYAEHSEESFRHERKFMVERQLVARGITNLNVLAAFHKIPRHQFVLPDLQDQSYEDHPIQIGHNQTISQPYIVALSLEQLDLAKNDRVLEIGTGSGYQTALLAELVKEVYSVEIIPELYRIAQYRLNFLGISNVNLRHGDGRKGWPEKSPFDAIVIAAAADEIPKPLIDQLKEGGRIIAPIGDHDQKLILGQKVNGKFVTKSLVPVRFVPLT